MFVRMPSSGLLSNLSSRNSCPSRWIVQGLAAGGAWEEAPLPARASQALCARGPHAGRQPPAAVGRLSPSRGLRRLLGQDKMESSEAARLLECPISFSIGV